MLKLQRKPTISSCPTALQKILDDKMCDESALCVFTTTLMRADNTVFPVCVTASAPYILFCTGLHELSPRAPIKIYCKMSECQCGLQEKWREKDTTWLVCGLKHILHADCLYQITAADFIIISSQLNSESVAKQLYISTTETICLNILPEQQRMLTKLRLCQEKWLTPTHVWFYTHLANAGRRKRL